MRKCWLLAGGMIAATGLGLAGCVAPTPEPAPAPVPIPAPAPSPPPVVPAPTGWMDQPLTPGDWHYVADANATRALFGPARSDARFTVACERTNRQIKLWRPFVGQAAATSMTITTTEAVKTVPVTAAGGPMPQVVATLAPYDPILDAMIFSRGRIAIQVAGSETLYLPSWSEIARVVEDCR
ncbi:hypothetical protein EKN06_00985 [Croceicoccus ponticola]|uniref:Lipoprotein n=2 Tax=Croceicoccus ponticola TaxID=2217664 RepID=A0A437H247_9SPHN|nr:hypothetical protein EKN06_00985 [Croceicoccus ponticola]